MLAGLRSVILVVVCGLITLLSAQRIDLGVKAAVPTNAFQTSYYLDSITRPYAVGPRAEVFFKGPWSVEASALYQRFSYDFHIVNGSRNPFPRFDTWQRTFGNTLELPVLLNVRAPINFGAGIVARRLYGVTQTETSVIYDVPPLFTPRTVVTTTQKPEELSRRNSVGLTVRVGLERRLGRVVIAPEFRFTRWDTPRSSNALSVPRLLERNQLEGGLAISYVVREGTPENRRVNIPIRSFQWESGVLLGVSLVPVLNESLDPSPLYSYRNIRKPLVAGAFLECRVNQTWSLEGSFVARGFAFRQIYSNPYVTVVDEQKGTIWEVPFLIKRRLHKITFGAGSAGRWQSDLSPFWSRPRTGLGIAAMAGWEKRTGHFTMRPEIRYHYWTRPMITNYNDERGTSPHSLYLIFGIGTTSKAH